MIRSAARTCLPALLLGLAVLLLTPGPGLALQDTSMNRRDQANRYIAAMPVSTVLETSLVRVTSLMPPVHREPFFAYAKRNIDHNRLHALVFEALTTTFTAEELKAMADFFGSPVGQSVASKMGVYTQRVMIPVLKEVQAVATRYARQNGVE